MGAGPYGGMAEWSNAAVLKTAECKLRGFESLSLRFILLRQAVPLAWNWPLDDPGMGRLCCAMACDALASLALF